MMCGKEQSNAVRECHRMYVYAVLCVAMVIWQGKYVDAACTEAAILSCAAKLVNLTHPIIGLPLGNPNSLNELCTTNRTEFRNCSDSLVPICQSELLINIFAINKTIDHICSPVASAVLSAKGTCISGVLRGERIRSCDIAVYERIFTTPTSTLTCSKIVDFLTCVRWVTWSFCQADAAAMAHDINKLSLDGVIKQLNCVLQGDNEQAGLAVSYTLSGIYYAGWSITNPQPTLFRVEGDPSEWVPHHLDTGTGGTRKTITALSRTVKFGYLAADYWHNKLLWVEMGAGTLNELPLYFQGTTSSQVIFGALSTEVTGIAVDWIAENVYVTDKGYKWIGQISYKPGFVGHHSIIIDTDIDSPGGIVTHPRLGKIFWSDTTRGTIESAAVDGKDRMIIKSSINAPQTLCIDYPEERIYWISDLGHKVTSCSVGGQDCRDVITQATNLPRFLDMDVYEDYLFIVADKQDMGIYNKTGESQLGRFSYPKHDRQTVVSTNGVTVAAPDKQYPYDNPCFFNNGECSQLCIQNQSDPEGRTCACSLGYVVMADGVTCGTEPFSDEFLLVADQHGHDIYMIDVNTGDVQAVPIRADAEPSSVAFDQTRNSVLWVDSSTGSYKVTRTAINGSFSDVIIDFGRDLIMELTYDRHTEYLYCTKKNRGQIVRVYTGGALRSDVIVTSPGPVDITLDAGTRTMFWTDWGQRWSSTAKIYKANMDDGSGKLPIVSHGLAYPTGLEIDAKARQLYFSDIYQSYIERVNLDGTGRQIIVRLASGSFHSIALDDNYLYIADVDDRNLRRYNRQNGVVDTFGPPEFQYAVSIRLYNSNIEAYVHPTTTTTSTTTPTTTPTTPRTTTPTTTQTTALITTPTTITTTVTTTLISTPITVTTTQTTMLTTTSPVTTTMPTMTTRTHETTAAETTDAQCTTVATSTTSLPTSAPAPTTTVATSGPVEDTIDDMTSTPAPTTITTPAATTSIPVATPATMPLATPVKTKPPTSTTVKTKPPTSTTVKTKPPTSTSVKTTTPTTTSTTTPTTTTRTKTIISTTTTPAPNTTSNSNNLKEIERLPAILGQTETINKSGVNVGIIAAVIVLGILLGLAVAGFVWYNRNVGPVRIFRTVVARYSSRDDTVILTDADTPMSDPPGTSYNDLVGVNDQWAWSSGTSNC